MSFNSVLSSDKLFKKTVKKNGQYLTDFLVDCIIGGVSAAISKTAVAPIERIKLLMQYQDEMIKTGRLDRPYTNIVDCFSRIIREQGASALWKGNLIRVIHYYPTQAFNFALKDFFRQLFCMDEKRDDNLKWFLGNLASGGAAGAVSSTLVYSLDYARTRFVNDRIRGTRQFNGLIDVYRKTLATDGILGLYRGFFIFCAGFVVYRGLYFGMFDSLKPVVLSDALINNFFANFMLGWGVTIGASFASHPIDTIRRRMMMTSGKAVKYKSSMDCAAEIVKKEGVKSLFKGASVYILRALAGGGVLAVYDQLHLIFWRKKYGDGE